MGSQGWQVVVMVLILDTAPEFTATRAVQRGVVGAMESGENMEKDKENV